MADSIKIDIPAGYAADYEKSPAGLNATRVLLTIWAVDGILFHSELDLQYRCDP